MAREITEQDLANKGVSGLPDVPGLTTEAMQKKFDEISKELLVPRFNEMAKEVNEVNSNLTPLQTILNGTTTSSGNVVFQDFSENNVIIEARILDATYRKLDISKANGYGTAFTIFDIEGNRLANFDISIKVTYYPSALFN